MKILAIITNLNPIGLNSVPGTVMVKVEQSSPSREAHGRPTLQIRQFRSRAEKCIPHSNPTNMSGRRALMRLRERGQERTGSNVQVRISWMLQLVFKCPSLGFSSSPAEF